MERPQRELGRPVLALAYAIFFASGFAALLYQVIWQRMLALFSGADVFSVTLIVSAFMGGLGLGSLAGGHLADRRSRAGCLALFALAEASIGLFALASRALYYDVLYTRVGAVALGAPALAAILFASVLWPTFFMGISLPLLARGLTRSLDAAARTLGGLYGWNTFGAAAGAGVATWVLLRRLDLESCLWIGAALNLSCAAAAVPLRSRIGAEAAPSRVADRVRSSAPAPSGLGLPAWLLVYALAGAIALAFEIVWFRVLGVALKSTSFTFGTLLGVYLLGTASGSLAGARWVERDAGSPAARFLTLQTIAALWALVGLLGLAALAQPARFEALAAHFATTDHVDLLQGLEALGRGGIGMVFATGDEGAAARLFFLLYAALPALLILPATALWGVSFPFLQRAMQTDPMQLGRRVGWLQTANIAGSLGGSLLTGFALLPALGTSATARALGAAALVFPALALVAARKSLRTLAPALLAAAALAAAIAAFPKSGVFWAALHGVTPADILVSEDASGVSAIVVASSESASLLVMAGGAEVSSLPFGGYEGVHTLLGVLPVLVHPRPVRVAVIGIGSGDTAYAAAARADTREVAAIEIIGSQLTLLRAFAASRREPSLRAFLADPRIREVVGDGRTFVRRDREPFDVIEADALRVSSAYSGNLYSREYFALLRERLAEAGLAVSWLPTPRVRDTFVRSYPHALVLGQIGIGSEAPIPFDRDAIRARLREPRLALHFRRIGIEIEARVEAFLDGIEPRCFGPAYDRAALVDTNSDLFAKDEFLVDGARYAPAPR